MGVRAWRPTPQKPARIRRPVAAAGSCAAGSIAGLSAWSLGARWLRLRWVAQSRRPISGPKLNQQVSTISGEAHYQDRLISLQVNGREPSFRHAHVQRESERQK